MLGHIPTLLHTTDHRGKMILFKNLCIMVGINLPNACSKIRTETVLCSSS